MLLNKMRAIAQVIGFLCIVYFAVYGAVMVFTGAPPAWAANLAATTALTPQYLSYQGILRDAGGNLVNGTHAMIVNIYDAASGGNLVWGPETHANVAVRDGQFSLLLGQTTALNASVFIKPDRFVQLTVDGVVMNPTQRLAAVPYAMAATYATVLSAPDGDPVNAVTVENGGDVIVGDGSASHSMEIPMGGLCIDSDGACGSAGDGSLRVGAGGIYGTDASNSDLYLVPDSAGDVGIGTTSPKGALHVNGDYYGKGHLWLYAQTGDGTNGTAYVQARDDSGTSSINLQLRTQNAGTVQDVMRLTSSGNVGIGTTNPSAKLDVWGVVRGAYDATDYVEMTHGGTNGYINVVGDGNLDFRHESTTQMSLSDAGNLNVNGAINANALTIDGGKPIVFKKFHYSGAYAHWNTGYSTSAWVCGVAGFHAYGDFDENHGLDNLMEAYAWPDTGGFWHLIVDFSEENSGHWWDVVLLCIDSDIASYTGF